MPFNHIKFCYRCCVSNCVAFKVLPKKVEFGYQTLRVLASCAYEIEEKHAAELAHALYICHAKSSHVSPDNSLKKVPNALLSPCTSVALVI